MAAASQKAIHDLDAFIANEPKTPPTFNLEELGEQLLFHVPGDGMFYCYSVAKRGYKWAGPATGYAPIFSRLPQFQTKLERELFLDYVYNFQYVVYDPNKKTLEVMDPDTAADIILGVPQLTLPGVYKAAFTGY